MAEVQWIKLNVGMFDGNSFKKIKKAEIGGVKFRDKLTAVWFELMDLAGKGNAGGMLIESQEIPFASIEDIAILIDREPEEVELCMQFYINNRMVTVINDVYMLSNWAKYQNEDGLEKIREQTRKRVAKHRANQKLIPCNVTGNVTVTQGNATDIEEEPEEDKKKKKKEVKEDLHTLFQRLLPNYAISPFVEDKLSEWITYKTERKDTYTEQGLKTLLKRIETNCTQYGEQAICELIDDSMANNWQGIIFDRLKQRTVETKPVYKKPTKADEMNEFYRMAVEFAEGE